VSLALALPRQTFVRINLFGEAVVGPRLFGGAVFGRVVEF
jgi:hypothetical protein